MSTVQSSLFDYEVAVQAEEKSDVVTACTALMVIEAPAWCFVHKGSGRIVKHCPSCGDWFRTIPSMIRNGKGKYCSHRCRAHYVTSGSAISKSLALALLSGVPHWTQVDKGGGMLVKKCLTCGDWFKTRPSRISKYCSESCRDKSAKTGEVLHCAVCGKVFYRASWYIERGFNEYCSKKCSHVGRRKTVNTTCDYCGKSFDKRKCRYDHSDHHFCSHACWQAGMVGENSPNWRGGISFEPYCPKWTPELRMRIRAFFNNQCVVCGKSGSKEKRMLSCHHVEYNKKACCDGKPVQFAALCQHHHNQTNFDRDRWEAMLHRCIDEIWGGRSYFTREEYAALKQGG